MDLPAISTLTATALLVNLRVLPCQLYTDTDIGLVYLPLCRSLLYLAHDSTFTSTLTGCAVSHPWPYLNSDGQLYHLLCLYVRHIIIHEAWRPFPLPSQYGLLPRRAYRGCKMYGLDQYSLPRALLRSWHCRRCLAGLDPPPWLWGSPR